VGEERIAASGCRRYRARYHPGYLRAFSKTLS